MRVSNKSPSRNDNQIALGKRVFMIFDEYDQPPLGTGFNLERPGLVLTAQHVVQGRSSVNVVNTSGPRQQIVQSSQIVPHPTADVAAVMLPTDLWGDAEYFRIGIPSPGFTDFPLGEEVASYGYPQMGTEKPIPPRLMKGYLQRQFQYSDRCYTYSAYELGFPAFHGQSGSPVFLDNLTPHARNMAVGVVTRWVSFGSEAAGEVSAVLWAIGASLTPLADWIRALPTD